MSTTTTNTTLCRVAWCDRHAAAHDFDSETPDGLEILRTHGAEVGDVTTGGPPGLAYVDLSATETLRSSGSSIETPVVLLVAEYVPMTSQQAHEVAAFLTEAADRLDAILGGK